MNNKKDKPAQLRSFKRLTGKSLQYLVNEAYRILENPIILCNLDWQILAYAEGAITDDPIWNKHVQNSTITNEIKDFSINEGLSDTLISTNTVSFFHSDKLKHDRMLAKIYGKDGIIITFAAVVASDRPFKDGDAVLVEGVCKKISEEIQKMDHYKQYGQKILERYINKLIDTDLRKDKYAIDYIEIIYKGLNSCLYIAVADIGQCDPTYAKLVYYRDLFKQTRPAFKYSIYSQYIVIIMSTGGGTFYPKKCFNRLYKLFERDNIKVGISSRFENLFELSRYYNDALKALSVGLRADSRQHIFAYDDVVCLSEK